VVGGVVWKVDVEDARTVGGVGPGPVLGGESVVVCRGAVVVVAGRCAVVTLGPAGGIVVSVGAIVELVVAEVSSGIGGGSVSRVCTAAIESVGTDPSRVTCSLLAFIAWYARGPATTSTVKEDSAAARPRRGERRARASFVIEKRAHSGGTVVAPGRCLANSGSRCGRQGGLTYGDVTVGGSGSDTARSAWHRALEMQPPRMERRTGAQGVFATLRSRE
jgi:hypothetical protein